MLGVFIDSTQSNAIILAEFDELLGNVVTGCKLAHFCSSLSSVCCLLISEDNLVESLAEYEDLFSVILSQSAKSLDHIYILVKGGIESKKTISDTINTFLSNIVQPNVSLFRIYKYARYVYFIRLYFILVAKES